MESLKQFRRSLKLNQKEMAMRLGVSPSYYYKIESGIQTPSYEFMSKLKKTFPGVSLDQMFFDKTKRQR